MNKIDNANMKLFLSKVESNKWCFDKLAREKIKEFLVECKLVNKNEE